MAKKTGKRERLNIAHLIAHWCASITAGSTFKSNIYLCFIKHTCIIYEHRNIIQRYLIKYVDL